MYVHDGLDGRKDGLMGLKHGGVEVNRVVEYLLPAFTYTYMMEFVRLSRGECSEINYSTARVCGVV